MYIKVYLPFCYISFIDLDGRDRVILRADKCRDTDVFCRMRDRKFGSTSLMYSTQPSIQGLVGFRATAVLNVTRRIYVTGMRFGLMQAKVGLISFLANYEVRVSEKTPIPVVLDDRSLVLSAKGGMWLTIVNRQASRVSSKQTETTG